MLKTAWIIQNHMTPRREKQIPIRGTSSPGAEISVTTQKQLQRFRSGEDGA